MALMEAAREAGVYQPDLIRKAGSTLVEYLSESSYFGADNQRPFII
jgi:hypothetical protein